MQDLTVLLPTAKMSVALVNVVFISVFWDYHRFQGYNPPKPYEITIALSKHRSVYLFDQARNCYIPVVSNANIHLIVFASNHDPLATL